MGPHAMHHHMNRIFSERPVKIIVGGDAKDYYLHPGVLRLHGSPALKARLGESWSNGETTLDWTDCDEQTVACVLSYLYTQDYYVTPQSTAEDELPSEQGYIDIRKGKVKIRRVEGDSANSLEGISEQVDIKSTIAECSEPDEPVPDRPLTPLSRCIKAGLPAESVKTAAGTVRKTAQDPDVGIGAAIIIHAKVYSFAHRFLLPQLEELALQRLTQVLILLDESETRSLFSYLADAVHIIYDTTPSAKVQQNPARKLLSQFVALRFTALAGESLDALMAEGGDFAVDVTKKLTRRLMANSDSTHSLAAEIDQLHLLIERLEISNQELESKVRKAEKEITEWDSLSRGIHQTSTKKRRVTLAAPPNGLHNSDNGDLKFPLPGRDYM
ncbi:hypothetical protein DTO271D3_1426 [Paecilomyces variotii]|nr:hypothetical protein DTO169C6_56 [Paecilomyces variotii]KAJ9318169.1 hypothetical protein DTO271D3_1426 [Paecilomyces variotii]